MKNLRQDLKNKRLYFDGGFGTVMNSLLPNEKEPPELQNLKRPDVVTEIHRQYLLAGSNIITTNTFGVNCDKYDNYKELIKAAISCAKTAVTDVNENAYIAFDIGPSGRMLEPLGDLGFEEAVSLFAKNVLVAKECGIDLFIIETMNDSYETKAALLAVKENCDLPVFVTNAYDKSGKLITGASPAAMIAMLEGMGADAIGMNCSFGPDHMLGIADAFCEYSSLPLIANPNAGLPISRDGKTYYDISPAEFAEYMARLTEKGFSVLGGCCGTTPEHICETVKKTSFLPLIIPKEKDKTIVSSYTHAVEIDEKPILIGERINPTGKSKLKAALRENNISYILDEGIRQSDAGVHILDVNVGLPEIDEKEMMKCVVSSLQAVTSLPLQLDSSAADVLEASMRIYNGKPLINSVNGSEKSMSSIFPLVKKYGGTLIALTMDENGIPERAEDRFAIAEKITDTAKSYGISKKDIIVDPLCLTVSSGDNNAKITLQAVKLLKNAGYKTSLGVSNVSFGLPEREIINSSFFTSALECGLSCAIINPFSKGMMNSYMSFNLLHGFDSGCASYIEYATPVEENIQPKAADAPDIPSLKYLIIHGLREAAEAATADLLRSEGPLDIIDKYIVPALGEVGDAFEKKTVFLPQLLMSAEAASAAFKIIKNAIPKEDVDLTKAIILATVEGDNHDIGKNIVKVLLESYGFKVYDLGKNVPPSAVLEAVKKYNCRLVGLSALMTTTTPAMAKTIKLLRSEIDNIAIVVGGAVLTEEYAKSIDATAYCADAMDTVRFTQKFYTK